MKSEFRNPQSAIPTPRWLGPLLLAAAAGVAGVFAYGTFEGKLLAMAIGAGALTLAAFHFPLLLALLLVAIGPFNYAATVGSASIKLSEGLTALMLAIIFLRIAAADPRVLPRVRRAGLPLAALTLLGLLAVITAVPQPNVYNVRYELDAFVVFAYALLFFRRAWWPWLLGAILLALTLESIAALTLKFGYGLSGTNLFNVGGIELIQFSAEDLANLAGGSFRLSGTMGHKNLLAAFYVLLLPVVALEILHRGKLIWTAVLLPALVTLALTDSMTGWGATLLIVVLTLLYLRRFDYLALLTLAVLPLAAVGLYRFGGSILFRVGQIFGTGEGWGTVSSRFEIWNISMRLIREHPWMGIGRNNFLLYGKTFYGHAHNLFVMKTIEMGIPAGVAFAGFIVALMARTWRAIAHEAPRLGAEHQYYRTLGLWLGCLGFLSMNLFDFSYSHFSLGPLFLMLLGILLAIAQRLEDLHQ